MESFLLSSVMPYCHLFLRTLGLLTFLPLTVIFDWDKILNLSIKNVKKESCKCESLSCPVICDPWTVAHQVLCPENFPGKNIGVGSHSFLEGIFLTQGSNPGLPHCRQILYHMNHQRTLTLVDMDVKILKRILANQIDEYIKESYTMIKCKSCLQAWFIIRTSITVIHNMSKIKNKITWSSQ